MRRSSMGWFGAAALTGVLAIMLAPVPVRAENLCGPGWPQGSSAVRGQAFSGVVLGIERHDAPRGDDLGIETADIRFRVDRVYRDHPRTSVETIDLRPGTVITFTGNSCFGRRALGLDVGGQYLVSTRGLGVWGHVPTGSTAAWSLEGDRARFVLDMYVRNHQAEVWPGFAEADTIDEVLAIVAPNAPATDAVAAPPPDSGLPWGLALLAGIPGAWAALRRARRGDSPGRASRLGGGILVLLVAAFALPAPVAAENPCAPWAPEGPREVRGQAWSGVVLRIERERRPPRKGFDTATITFRVERVYRNHPEARRGAVDLAPGRVITITGESCTRHPALGLHRGDRYLLSTSTVYQDVTWPGNNISTAVAWRLDGDRASLVTAMYYRDWRDQLWPGFAEADTVEEVLAIVAPNAPATDAVASAPSRSEPPWGLALLAGLPGAWLAFRRTRRCA